MEDKNQLQVFNDLSELTIPLPLAVNEAGALVIKEFRQKCQIFNEALNRIPPAESIDTTPDNKAFTVLISHIEMTLDEMFFGMWDTVDFKWQVIANEIVGSILLVATHPVSGKEIKRTGAAAVQITVDATPEELKDQPSDSADQKRKKKIERNKWALNTDNKKSNALDMTFPKLKAECLKNAAQSLGKLFGRDLNRKKADNFRGLLKGSGNPAATSTKSEEVINTTKESIKKAAASKENGFIQKAGARTI